MASHHCKTHLQHCKTASHHCKTLLQHCFISLQWCGAQFHGYSAGSTGCSGSSSSGAASRVRCGSGIAWRRKYSRSSCIRFTRTTSTCTADTATAVYPSVPCVLRTNLVPSPPQRAMERGGGRGRSPEAGYPAHGRGFSPSVT